jgi:hypothetical protein
LEISPYSNMFTTFAQSQYGPPFGAWSRQAQYQEQLLQAQYEEQLRKMFKYGHPEYSSDESEYFSDESDSEETCLGKVHDFSTGRVPKGCQCTPPENLEGAVIEEVDESFRLPLHRRLSYSYPHVLELIE